MNLSAAGLAVTLAALLGLSAGPAAADPAGEQLAPDLVGAWLLLGDERAALDHARALLQREGAGWRAHAAYVQACLAGEAGWRVVDEYSWLADTAEDPELAADLAAWAAALRARGQELDQALGRLELRAESGSSRTSLLLGQALLGAGYDQRALVALEGLDGPLAARLQVRALLGAGQPQQAAALVLRGLEEHPDRPDIAVSLWGRDADQRGLRRARRRAASSARSALGSSDAVVLFHAWEVLALAEDREGAELAASALAGLVPGLRLPARVPYGGAMTRHLGEILAMTAGELDELDLSLAERQAVALSRARSLAADGLVERSLATWPAALGSEPFEPELLLELGALQLGLDAVAALDTARQARLAVALSSGLSQEQRALVLGRSFALQARALRALDRPQEALTAWLMQQQLAPGVDGLLELAERQEQLGAIEAAMESLAQAAAAGSPEAWGQLERLYRGPAAPAALVEAARTRLGSAGRSVRVLDARGPGASAPDRLLLDAELSTGAGPLSIAEFTGQPVVVAFWASWCAPCAEELPALAGLQRRWSEEDLPLRIIAISVDEREADYRRAARRYAQLGIQIAWSPDLAEDLDLRLLPTTWLLDSQGEVARRLRGYSPSQVDEIDEASRALLQN